MKTKTIDLDKLDVNKPQDRAILWGLGVEIEVGGWNASSWHPIKEGFDLFFNKNKFRRKPIETPKRTITIPQCLTEIPENGQIFLLNGYADDGCEEIKCQTHHLENSFIKRHLRNGFCFATEEDAKAVIAALRGEK